MKGILCFLGELNDHDIDWLLTKGHKRRLPVGTELVRKGKGHDELHLILQGEFSLSLQDGEPGKELRLGPGSVVGESSFVDGQPAPATVRALGPSVVLSIPVSDLTRRLQDDPPFATRFQHALGKLLAHRSQAKTARGAAERAKAEQPPDPLEMKVMDSMHLGGAHFKHILRRSLPA
jgi:CRP-like cAMP-binding protein